MVCLVCGSGQSTSGSILQHQIESDSWAMTVCDTLCYHTANPCEIQNAVAPIPMQPSSCLPELAAAYTFVRSVAIALGPWHEENQ